MWNKYVCLLIASINIKPRHKARFRMFFALPVFIILAFMDMLDDLSFLFAKICPYVTYKTAGNGVQSMPEAIRTLSGTLADFAWELAFEIGPYDFVDVDVKGKNELVRVKILTR